MTQPGGPVPVRVGDLLAGKYRVEQILGVGGMGVVVAARHEQLDQLVAIKFIRDEALGSGDAVQRFIREARAAGKLKSEHVARVLDVGTLESGAPYMVMELLEGSDLSQILSTEGPLPLETAIWFLLQACEALAEAHGVGIVHRDLKPGNLFVTQTMGGSPKLKVLDFGVAKAVGLTSGADGSLTRTRAMVGSPLYMAPEQMRSSRDVDARVDIWALGVVLFELLTQRWPFEAETMPELCLKVVGDPPQSLTQFRPDLPPELVAVVERCLEKDPAKRFDNAAELAAALESFAPPSARVLVDQARFALQSESERKRDGPRSKAARRARASSTPSAWSESTGGRTTGSTRRRPRTVPVVAIGAAALALVGIIAGVSFAVRGHGVLGSAADPPTASDRGTAGTAGVGAAPSPNTDPSKALSPSAESTAHGQPPSWQVALPASTVAAPPFAPTAPRAPPPALSATPSLPMVSATNGSGGSRRAAGASTAGARPVAKPPSGGVGHQDDDIPAFR